MTTPLLILDNVSKSFSKESPPSLTKIDGIISKGQIVGVVGPDGAGKTTLIRLMAGLLLPSSGKITINGYDTVVDAEKIHHLSGYMPQKFGLYEDLTVKQNLNLYADLRNLPALERPAVFEKLLQFTSLSPFLSRLTKNLSGGMKQKLALACALIKKPTLLFLDEPTVGVDPISRQELWKMVQELLQENITVVWSTAYLNEAERCDLVLLLSEGKLLFHGPPQELTKNLEGHTFKIVNIRENRRNLLSKITQDPSVVDGVIQGNDLRIVMKEKEFTFNSIPASVEAATPRFEDAFITLLGGIKEPISKLAAQTFCLAQKNEKAVVADHLSKQFGTFLAADQITFEAKRGEIFGLLGPNGAGKSTTFKMLCGLLRPTSGTALINGVDLQKAPGKARSRIGYMPQKFSLYSALNVKQNLEFFSGVYNLSGKDQIEAVEKMVAIFKLKPYLHTTADLLPLGFKQRLSLACATMHQPEILFLDEPTSGVDPLIRREFWTHINGLVEKGICVMVTTHFMDEAEYCDRVALIYQGKMIHLDTPDKLKELVRTQDSPNPTLEDAFIKLIEEQNCTT